MGHPSHADVTELVVVGRDQIEALLRMLTLFRDHKVGLLGLESQGLPETSHFIITAYADTKAADCSLETLLGLLRELFAVESAEGAALSGSRYDRFLFPVVALDSSRLVITSAENLAQVERYFSKLPREAGTQVLFEMGRQSGLAITRSLRRSHTHVPQKEMLAMAEDELRTSGWGLFDFDVAEMERGTVGVTVRDPIVMNVSGATESWMTFGLCSGLIEGIYGMAGYVSGKHAYSEKTRQIKFKLIELSSLQKTEESGR
jgi:hypothetical protein